MKKAAEVVQMPDNEKKYLLRTVIHPRDLAHYNMAKYLPKTFMINIGSMYYPLSFRFGEIIGDFVVYFSTKEKIPNDENGYEEKFEN